ncbi:antiterminator Q family protein [Izhakiella capsodis]|nr:antiterminator Q family protein [Izhakiella capsodis]
MQQVLERWGRWAASEEYCSLLDWPAMSVTCVRKPKAGKSGCSDEDGLAIDTCVAHMSTVRHAEDILILGQRFIGHYSLRQIAEVMKTDINVVRRSLQTSEAFLSGCLVMLGIRLDMDLEVAEQEPLACTQKPVLFL